MLLSIYKLEDGKEPICSFGIGEHMLGRGNVLQCMDKRVSRKHAEIIITTENITITAKHEYNPCFYRANDSKHISILKYNFPVELSSGDAFGFFPDEHWFKIKITADTSHENGLDHESNFTNKRTASGDDNESPSKKIQKQNEDSTVHSFQLATTSNASSNGCDHYGNDTTSDMNISMNTSNHLDNTENSKHALNNSGTVLNNTASTSFNLLNNTANTSNILNNTANTSNISNNIANIASNLLDTTADNSSNLLNNTASTSHHINNELPSPTSTTNDEVVIKQEITEDDEGNNACGNESDEQCDSTIKVKVELDSDPVDTHDNQVTNSSTVDASRNEANKQSDSATRVKEEVETDSNENQVTNSTTVAPSSSTTTPPDVSSSTTRRDRCWYGNGCYRRHSDHLLKFSHQGDSDYDTDPGDNRPQCLYGASCYRKNKQHRIDFKHSRFTTKPTKKQPPPRKKPKKSPKKSPTKANTSDGDVDTSNIVNTKRPRNNKPLVDSPMDDYDYDDPFLDDGSEDDFQLDSEDSESD